MKLWKTGLNFIFVACILSFPFASYGKRNNKNDQSIQSEAGLKIPEYGIAIDAYYLPALDSLVPGYHILNIVIQNNRPDPINMDVLKDKWEIVDNIGKKVKAINHIKLFNKDLWGKMSEKAKAKLEYPNVIPPGTMVAVDVFFNNSVELTNFKEIRWQSAFFDKEFNVYTAYEKQLKIEYDTTKVIEKPNDEKELQNNQIQQDEYIKARDQFVGKHDSDVQKVFYIAPDGTMKEVDEDKLQESNLPVDFSQPTNPPTEQK